MDTPMSTTCRRPIVHIADCTGVLSHEIFLQTDSLLAADGAARAARIDRLSHSPSDRR
jgi:hypothetical protein